MNIRKIVIQLFILFIVLYIFSFGVSVLTNYRCEKVGNIISFDISRQTLKTDLVKISTKSKEYIFDYGGEKLSTGQELFVCSNGKFYTQ